jgi:alkylation response protein AidB-like acyl-CoA dehydrogenase
MDWTPTDLMAAVSEGARAVLQAEPASWDALTGAGMLDIDDLCAELALLVEVGATGAQVPAFEVLSLGWPARRLHPGAALLTGAPPSRPGPDAAGATLTARGDRLSGTLTGVTGVSGAAAIAVHTGDAVWAIDPSEAELTPGMATDHSPAHQLRLHDVAATRLGGPELLHAWHQRVDLGVAALQLGLSRQAIQLTASYVGQREQFGRKIGTFQAVSQRLADAWIDLVGVEVTLWQAAWRVAEGVPADREVWIARWQAGEAAHRITAAAQHLHGGFGFDRDYPLYRQFVVNRRVAALGGGPQSTLESLGDLLAARASA